MPPVNVILFRENNGDIPFLKWAAKLNRKARVKCYAFLERLRENGHELRRPEADFLRDSIYELRIGHQGINYRILYFFTIEKL